MKNTETQIVNLFGTPELFDRYKEFWEEIELFPHPTEKNVLVDKKGIIRRVNNGTKLKKKNKKELPTI